MWSSSDTYVHNSSGVKSDSLMPSKSIVPLVSRFVKILLYCGTLTYVLLPVLELYLYSDLTSLIKEFLKASSNDAVLASLS